MYQFPSRALVRKKKDELRKSINQDTSVTVSPQEGETTALASPNSDHTEALKEP